MDIYVLADDYAGYNSRFWAQHGASYLIESEEGTILFDTGTFGELVLRNLKELGKSVKDIDAIVLSHCHYDHTGGLLKILEELVSSVPIYAHPSIFRPCLANRNSSWKNVGVPEGFREKCEKFGAYWILSEKPTKVIPGAITTGEVPRIDEPIPKGDCYTIKEGKMVKDPMADDMGLLIDLGNSCFLVTGCTHSGIINMVIQGTKITGKRITGILGGLHLLNESEVKIRETCKKLKERGVQEVYVGHCTGLLAECIMAKSFREKFHLLHCGMKVSLDRANRTIWIPFHCYFLKLHLPQI